MIMKSLTPMLLFSAIYFSGCISPMIVDYDRASAAKFNDYHCFVIDNREARANYQDVVLSPIVDRRIESAISQTLAAKGMKQDCLQPDFRVTFNTVTQTKTEVNDLGVGSIPFRRHSSALLVTATLTSISMSKAPSLSTSSKSKANN
jgi:hypothetical protein